MKIRFLTIFVCLLVQQSFGQTDTIVVNNNRFLSILKKHKNEYGTNDTLMKLYRLENNKPKYLLSHYLYKYSVDCDNQFRDIGRMEIRKDSLIFIKHYLQSKKIKDPVPEWRKQIYIVSTTGKLQLLYDKYKMHGSKWSNTDFKDDQ